MLRVLAFSAALVASTAVFAQNIATVNGKPIAKAREDAWVEQLKKQGQQDTPQLREQIKDQLIQREIFMQEVGKRGIAERPDVKFQLDVQRQNALIQALMRDELAKSPITDEQIKAAYEEQKKATGAKEYKVRHILVESEVEAKDVTAQLKKGGKWEDLAKKSKDPGSAQRGGELEWAGAGAYVKPFSDAMVKLDKGQMTDAPVQSQFGWHVIKVDDIRDAQFPPLEQVAPQIREALQQRKMAAFAEQLRKNAKVQ
ncbi:MAG: peptidylprolyl isomerase [Burkholderiales bacterium]|nr:MAG: peptidylprolyl isomerase [Burkholderiales bacterium]